MSEPEKLSVINDGYTFNAEFPGRFGIPKFSITYRPALPERVLEYQLDPRGKAKDIMASMARLIKDQVISWTATAKDGSVSPLTASALAKTPLPAIDWMVETVCTYQSSQEAADDLKN